MEARTLTELHARLLPRPPRLFAIDVDGTLLTSDHRITALTRDAIARTLLAGAEIVLASSRPPQALEPILRQLDLVEPVVFVASQGAVTGTAQLGGGLRIHHRESLPLQSARDFARDAARAGRTVSWFTPTSWFVSRIDDDVRWEAEVVGLEPVLRDLCRLEDPPDKLMLMSTPAHELRTDPLWLGLPAILHAQASSVGYVELTVRGTDKATALRRYCDTKQVRASSVAAIGDGPNDLSLFEYAGTSIAMANSRVEVLDKAQFVTRSNDEEGVATALDLLMRARPVSSRTSSRTRRGD